ncbi:MAG TPA: porin, partial [Steroidobacteraceae bacterium]|nr:porin [Steroidobacteraceae bacterium]
MQSTAFADDAADNKALKEQMRQMMQRMDELQKQVQQLSKQQQAAPAAVTPSVPAAPPPAVAQPGAEGQGPKVSKETQSEPLFQNFVKGFFGTLDVSIDDSTKGMNGFVAYPYSYVNPSNPNSGYVRGSAKNGGAGPVGRVGWEADLSTNKSVIGYRGSHRLPGTEFDLIYQLEVQPQITHAPGVSDGYTSQSDVTKGGIGYGDSYLGIANNDLGKLKLGTTYTPYKKATDRMNPFSGMLGDYGVMMGNTGGDNRVEFGTRIDHSIWYESPVIHGFSFDVLFSPGQNRTPDSVAQSSGSPDCNGGNVPGSGNLPLACDDGGYDNAYSADIKFETGPIYLTAAWELHKSVNRNSDGVGANSPYYNYLLGLGNGVSPLLNWAAYDAFAAEYPEAAPAGTPEYATDVANEWAVKFGAQYTFDFGLVVSGIYEDMHRDVPADLEFQNERQRNGLWFAASQDFTIHDNVSVGWAHAGATPGDPGGQHNYDPTSHANTANMYTVAWKHRFDKNTYWYVDAAETVNGRNAHYDL